MPLTPLDVLQKQFGPARKGGYDADEVQRFLDEVREAWEASLKENFKLREELATLDAAVDALREVAAAGPSPSPTVNAGRRPARSSPRR